MENRITFEIKSAYSLELLRPDIMKLLGSNKNKITKDQSSENMLHLEIAVLNTTCITSL